MLDLHRRLEKADWEYIPPDKRTAWQRLAARTNGIVTPANIITVGGLGLTIAGMLLFLHDHYAIGIMLIVIGRLADILDGVVAARTQTKAALGEILDSGADKVAIAVALGLGLIYGLVPTAVIATILGLNIINLSAAAYGKLRARPLHPSQQGKHAMALSWIVIVLFLASTVVSANQILFFANMAFWLYVFLGLWASYAYVRQLFASQR